MSKIINLEAYNIKAIKHIKISPEGNIIIIAGNNAVGKSSVLDTIPMLMGAEKTKTKMPLRNGAVSGHIKMELDDYIITRKYTEKNDYLRVENKDGDPFGSPQKVLDKISGALTFDPFSFINMKPDKQLETLKQLLGLDFSELDTQRKELYDQRTIVNSEIKSLKNQIEAIKIEECPDKEISVSELVKELERRQEVNKKYDEMMSSCEKLGKQCDEKMESIEAKQKEIEKLQEQIKTLFNETNVLTQKLEESKKQIGDYQQEDTEEIRFQINNAESTNQKVRTKKKKLDLEKQHEEKTEKSDSLTDKIAEIDKSKKEQLENADLPVPGLSFDESGISFNGIPLPQCSSSEQLRVSLGMGIKMNPKFKVLLIKDGSLADEDTMNEITKMAELNDYQIWIERVGTKDKGAIIIHDGMIAKEGLDYEAEEIRS